MALSSGPGATPDHSRGSEVTSLRTINRRGGKGDIPAEFMSRHADVLSRAAILAIGARRQFPANAEAKLHVQAHGDRTRFGGPHPETFEVIVQVGGAIFGIGRIEGNSFIPSDLLSAGRKATAYADGPMGQKMETAIEPAKSGLSRNDLDTLASLVQHLVLDSEKPASRTAEVAPTSPEHTGATGLRRTFAGITHRVLGI